MVYNILMPMNKFFALSLLLVIGTVFLASNAKAVQITDPLGAGDFTTLINRISTGIGAAIGSLAVVVLLIAGIYFLTSAGNPERMQLAKRYLTYAIIGIVIALLASTIVDIILEILQ